MGGFEGVIFDMDGTLIEPLIDFAGVRAELGIADGEGIIEALDVMQPGDARPLYARLVEHEVDAARRADLHEGAAEAVEAAAAAGLRVALLTRSAPEAMAIVIERFALAFDLAWARDRGPIKPEPDGVLRACREMDIDPARTACVGDFRYDIVAANAAGAVSVLYCPAGPPAFADEADHLIESLGDLPALLGIGPRPAGRAATPAGRM